MNIIKTLSPHVADLIAAGEVVERPASVVKELLENSFDASASRITVEIQRGGMGLIRVTDNGCGMSPEDAGTAFLRHATSKLRDAEGLEAIGTLGFRGEALAAIASVSRIQLLTREKGSTEGIALSLEAGREISRAPAGCPEGCTILVRDLFYNTPARLKFMKKDSYEGSAVTAAVIRCALSHPSVSIRYLKDGIEAFKTAGSGKADACIYSVLGREFARDMLHAVGSSDGISVDGYVSSPAATHGNRSMQYFFVNGRYIKSQLIQTALEKAYQNRLFTGRFPACVLFLRIRQNAVDVNVHPAKTEVRFLQEKQVFDAVFRSVSSALDHEKETPELSVPIPSKQTAGRSETASPKSPLSPEQEPQNVGKQESLPVPDFAAGFGTRHTLSKNDMKQVVQQLVFKQSDLAAFEPGGSDCSRSAKDPRTGREIPIHSVPLAQNPETEATEQATPKPSVTFSSSVSPAKEETDIPEYRIIGELFREYLLVEVQQSLLLIDKHAVHERILFDRLLTQTRDTMVQMLLAPQIVTLNPQDKEILLSNRKLLNELGLELREYNLNSVSVHTLPYCCSPDELHSFLCQIAEALYLGVNPDTLGQHDEVLATMACKAAIKAGMNNDINELVPLVEAVLTQKVKYCPHGRPVSFRLTRNQIDKSFKRS